jgi:uncharacterized membrane protein
VRYERLVERAFEKIRQAARAMPAVFMRQLDALTRIMLETTLPEQRELLVEQAELVWRAAETSIGEPADLADVRRDYDVFLATAERVVMGEGG